MNARRRIVPWVGDPTTTAQLALPALAGTGARVVIHIRADLERELYVLPKGADVENGLPFAAGQQLVVNGHAWWIENVPEEAP